MSARLDGGRPRSGRAGALDVRHAAEDLDQGTDSFAGQRGRHRGRRFIARSGSPRRRRTSPGCRRRASTIRARLAARHVWIVDPIDGTRAYIAGLPDWAVSVALVADGRPIVACLFAPVERPILRRPAPMPAPPATGRRSRRPRARNSTARGSPGPRGLLERLAAVVPPFTAMPRMRSLALRLAQVAHGALRRRLCRRQQPRLGPCGG